MIQKEIEIKGITRIVVISDLHIGLKGYRDDIFDDMIKELKKPNTLWIGLGDFIEGREPSHKFYDASEVNMTVGEQYGLFFEKIRPYVKTCIGLHPGNHEDSLVMKTTINPLLQFCNEHKITYLGAVARTSFVSGDKKISMMTAHGAGGGVKVGGALNRIIDYAKTFNSDIVCVGHFHKLCHSIELKYYEDEEGRIRWSPMDIVLNGSALEAYMDGSYGGYVERKLLQPSALGFTIITLDKNLEKSIVFKAY